MTILADDSCLHLYYRNMKMKLTVNRDPKLPGKLSVPLVKKAQNLHSSVSFYRTMGPLMTPLLRPNDDLV